MRWRALTAAVVILRLGAGVDLVLPLSPRDLLQTVQDADAVTEPCAAVTGGSLVTLL